jgi:hypothetical protein
MGFNNVETPQLKLEACQSSPPGFDLRVDDSDIRRPDWRPLAKVSRGLLYVVSPLRKCLEAMVRLYTITIIHS